MSGDKEIQAIGFITVCEQDAGAFGGYLLVNAAGRPLEFHCTTPVKPNRAQEILYGPTLEPYLYGELIGTALVTKSKLRPQWIVTDNVAVLAIRETINLPVACLVESRIEDLTVTDPIALDSFQVVAQVRYRQDLSQIQQLWNDRAVDFDLSEPFERIRNAIQEAQRARGNRAA